MQEERFKIFIHGAQNYFRQISEDEIVVGTPYLVENKMPAAHDYTGIIAISGLRSGIVYFTAPKELLVFILKRLNEPLISEEYMIDLVGEVANTIAGNARSEFGERFEISVPIVIRGAPDDIMLPRTERSYIIPLKWHNYEAAVVIALRKTLNPDE